MSKFIRWITWIIVLYLKLQILLAGNPDLLFSRSGSAAP
jgi:hypothetical protein